MTRDLGQGKHTLTVVNVHKGESKFGPTDKEYTLKLDPRGGVRASNELFVA